MVSCWAFLLLRTIVLYYPVFFYNTQYQARLCTWAHTTFSMHVGLEEKVPWSSAGWSMCSLGCLTTSAYEI